MKRNKVKASNRQAKVAHAADTIFMAQHIVDVYHARKVIADVIFSLRGEETHNM